MATMIAGGYYTNNGKGQCGQFGKSEMAMVNGRIISTWIEVEIVRTAASKFINDIRYNRFKMFLVVVIFYVLQ